MDGSSGLTQPFLWSESSKGDGYGATVPEEPLLLAGPSRVRGAPERRITWWQLTALAYVMVAVDGIGIRHGGS